MDGREGPARHPVATRQDRPAECRQAAAPGGYDGPPMGRSGIRIPPFMIQRRHSMNGQWPLQDFLELGALASAVPCARLHARQVLWEWGLESLWESTELLVAELVTNAVKASRAVAQASSVRLWLLSDSAQILILVWDASPQPPVRMDASDEAENGRGLMLVEAIGEQWGWYRRDDGDGKFVWATAR